MRSLKKWIAAGTEIIRKMPHNRLVIHKKVESIRLNPGDCFKFTDFDDTWVLGDSIGESMLAWNPISKEYKKFPPDIEVQSQLIYQIVPLISIVEKEGQFINLCLSLDGVGIQSPFFYASLVDKRNVFLERMGDSSMRCSLPLGDEVGILVVRNVSSQEPDDE